MERWFRAVVVCLAVLLTWTGPMAGEKTAEERARDHACGYFGAVDANGDGRATYVDYVYLWLHVPLIGKEGNLYRDIERQLIILKQFAIQFPFTDKNLLQSLCTGGIDLDGFLAVVENKRHLPLFKDQIDGFLNFIFNALSYDGDVTRVNPYEFTILYQVFNLSGTNTSFEKLDANRDEYITKDEAKPKAYDFFITAVDPEADHLIGTPTTCEAVRSRNRTWVDPVAEGRLVLSVDKFGTISGLVDLLSKVPGLSDLIPNLREELLRIASALVNLVPK